MEKETPLLENLTAEECRKVNKLFEGLPYSPAEVETAKLVAFRITEAARLGFQECVIYAKLSGKLKGCLRENGFRVIDAWKVGQRGSCWVDFDDVAIICWGDNLPNEEILSGLFLSKELATEEYERRQADIRKSEAIKSAEMDRLIAEARRKYSIGNDSILVLAAIALFIGLLLAGISAICHP